MNAGGPLVMQVDQRLSDAAFREQIRAMHANQTPLLEMVDTLGLSPAMSPAVRAIVEQLGPAVVAEIRQATLEMLDRAVYAMPVDCSLTEAQIDGGTPVTVTVAAEAAQQTIIVRAAPA